MPKEQLKKDNPEKLATYGRQDKEKQKQRHNRHYYAQTCTNNVHKTCTLLQTSGGKDEPNIVFMLK